MHTVPAFSRADAQHHPRPYERSDDGRRRDGAALGRDDRRMEGMEAQRSHVVGAYPPMMIPTCGSVLNKSRECDPHGYGQQLEAEEEDDSSIQGSLSPKG